MCHLLKELTEKILMKMNDQDGWRAASYGLGKEEIHGGVSEEHTEGLLESAEDAHRHRLARGEKEKEVVGATGLGKHYNIGGGLADSGPVDTERA